MTLKRNKREIDSLFTSENLKRWLVIRQQNRKEDNYEKDSHEWVIARFIHQFVTSYGNNEKS